MQIFGSEFQTVCKGFRRAILCRSPGDLYPDGEVLLFHPPIREDALAIFIPRKEGDQISCQAATVEEAVEKLSPKLIPEVTLDTFFWRGVRFDAHDGRYHVKYEEYTIDLGADHEGCYVEVSTLEGGWISKEVDHQDYGRAVEETFQYLLSEKLRQRETTLRRLEMVESEILNLQKILNPEG